MIRFNAKVLSIGELVHVGGKLLDMEGRFFVVLNVCRRPLFVSQE